MSKQYSVDLNIDISKLTPKSGLLMAQVEKDVDPRGFKERTAPEVFAFVCTFAINGANPKCSYAQLQSFRRISGMITKAAGSGVYVANKTDIDIIKNSIEGNRAWPNDDEILNVLDAIMEKFKDAKEGVTPNGAGADTK